MIELYLSKVTENSESEQAGKYYARVSYKQTMGVQEMAHHMAEHNTMFSEGSITGILIDFVKCVREMVLMGNTVKIENLAIFKATVEANALEVLYDAEQDKVALASIGTLAEGQKTGAAVKTVKLLAQSTGDFTRDELKKDVKLAWTDKTKSEIAAAKGGNAGTESGGSNTGTNTGENGGNGDNTGNGDDTGNGDLAGTDTDTTGQDDLSFLEDETTEGTEEEGDDEGDNIYKNSCLTLTKLTFAQSTLSVSATVINKTGADVTFHDGLGLYDDKNKFVKIVSQDMFPYKAGQSRTNKWTLEIADVDDGTYRIYPVSKLENGDGIWHFDKCGSTTAFIGLTIEEGVAKLSDGPAIVYNSFELDNKQYDGEILQAAVPL